jgi:bile acid-coenzyme A ligase
MQRSVAVSRVPVSFGRRLTQLAAQRPVEPAIVWIGQGGAERVTSWEVLDRRSNQLARAMRQRNVGNESLVVIGLPNVPEHFIAGYAAWKLGALVLPLKHNLPKRERDQILEVGAPTLVVADWDDVAVPTLGSTGLAATMKLPDAPLPDIVPHPGKAIGSGGSTGRPKIIVDPRPWARVPGELGALAEVGLRSGQVQLVAGPLYHNSPFSWSHYGLFEGHTLVVMERFDAARTVELIECYRVNFGFLAPTMMRRIIQLPGIHTRDLSSVQSIFHTAAPCPPWLKRAWIELIGPEHLYEGFGATEAVGSCGIRGDEWLAHPGSVGRPRSCDLRILDETGHELPDGEVGEIFMRPWDSAPTYYYVGSPPAKSTPDGFVSVGDIGWVDADGYLFLADRRTDLIITGGANVYPAEVEAALTEHPSVGDVAVIGLPDDDWGKRVHAVVQLAVGSEPAAADLECHCRERLASYKVPKTWEFVEQLPRDDAGKLRRSALVAERTGNG